MFIQSVHREPDVANLQTLIHENPLGVITTAIPSATRPLLLISHIPLILDADDGTSKSGLGRLRGHIARQNPQVQSMIEALGEDGSGKTLEQEVLVLFTAAPHSYVTPKFYVETKPTTAKVVPTWNYAAAQVYGRAKLFFDSKSEETAAFLTKQVHDLSQHAETSIMDYTGKGDRPGPWKVADAPERYVEYLMKNIVGIEIEIDRLEGKFKMSQEMRKGDREGVIAGFRRMGTDTGDRIADIVQQRGEMKDNAAKTAAPAAG